MPNWHLMFGISSAADSAAVWVEKGSAHGDDERDDDADGGDGIRNDVPSVAGTEPARLVEFFITLAERGVVSRRASGGSCLRLSELSLMLTIMWSIGL